MDIKKLAVIAAGAALLAGIFVVLRERTGEGASSGAATTIRLSVREGAVVGGVRRVTVPEGRRVAIIVDAAGRDRIHVHGYEHFAELEPGSPARLEFRARFAGSFDVELEERRLLLVRLDVRP